MPTPEQYNKTIEEVETKKLRDQFAMAALTGILGNSELCINISESTAEAYIYADAMLEARK